MSRPSVALVGVSGYGRRHLLDLLRLHSEGRVELVGIADPSIPSDVEAELERFGARPQRASSLGDLHGLCSPQTVVIATPPHTHFPLAVLALNGGASVYVEKPPVPLPEQLDELERLAVGRRVEFGFQQTRSVIMAVDAARRERPIGQLRRVVAYGSLQRPDSYYDRAPWAGRRTLGDTPVFDGSLFNPLAHTVHAALALAQREEPAWTISELEVELGAAREIEADDTAALRVRSASGPIVVAVGTTAGDDVIEGSLLLVGTAGVMRVRLRDLRIEVEADGTSSVLAGAFAPAALDSAVCAPQAPADQFTDISAVRAFVRLVAAAVEAAPSTERLAATRRVDGESGPRTELPGLTSAVARAAADGLLLSEAGVRIGRTHRRHSLENWDGRLTSRHPGQGRPKAEVSR
ncbi:Gfo/Idh/MocA family oxidoreductase [Microbacterium sp.]|uniref:Gfo/Idh/MocA family protein n=1 Tax=Microbacterium sp. TaxID=51671 RepID=UPI0026166D33|nr:Gfo/Idh/MocA family oxidoreductase [Microbacterium sp.]